MSAPVRTISTSARSPSPSACVTASKSARRIGSRVSWPSRSQLLNVDSCTPTERAAARRVLPRSRISAISSMRSGVSVEVGPLRFCKGGPFEVSGFSSSPASRRRDFAPRSLARLHTRQ